MDYQRWAEGLVGLGQELTAPKSLSDLLNSILTDLRELTNSDAGTIYRIVEVDGEKRLKFEQAQNFSVDIPQQMRATIKIDNSSVAGYVASTGEVVNLEDVYELPSNAPYSCDTRIDRATGYRAQSMLVVPLVNRRSQTKGVLQLINRKREPLAVDETEVLPYPREMAELVRSAAGQAAVALERASLEKSVQTMLESIVRSLVLAIENRDQVTSGHSERLAEYAVETAAAIDRAEFEPWFDEEFSTGEIEALYYASLTHDIGKLVVPEEILQKENRLSEECMRSLRFRLVYLESRGKIEAARPVFEELQEINQARTVTESMRDRLDELSKITVKLPGTGCEPLLSEEERKNLAVGHGTLTPEEREIVESHPEATHKILQEVNWTEELEEVPWLASLHHERLNGEGYPRGLEGDEIPLRGRILAVVDIYEALTATDRPYRESLSPGNARRTIEDEVEAGALDGRVVEVFFNQVEEVEAPN